MTCARFIFLCIYFIIKNKCKDKNPYPIKYKTSIMEISIGSSPATIK